MSTSIDPFPTFTCPISDEALEAVKSQKGSPTWEMVRYFPKQGDWTEEQYLKLEHHEGMIEFDPGSVLEENNE